jgi:hypothetical protein
MLDNSEIIAKFCPAIGDGDTFIYTEMLDRRKEGGNNNRRLVKTFYHHEEAEFWEQWPLMKELADNAKVRLMTRLAPRSYEKVGKLFTQLVVEAAMAGNWSHMKKLYNSACGRVTPNQKLWLLDVDEITEQTTQLGVQLHLDGHLVASIPSKKGIHYVIRPFDSRSYHGARSWNVFGEVSLHKDNPTNLYIPEGAA